MPSDQWRFETATLDELDRFLEHVCADEAVTSDVLQARFYGDGDAWPCPYCTEIKSCPRVGTTSLDKDGVPKPHDEVLVGLKRSRSLFGILGDPLGSLAGRVSTEILSGPDTLEARVYGCTDHGNFYIRRVGDQDDPFMPWRVRDDSMVTSPPLYWPCLGLIVDESPEGEILGVEVCQRLTKWSGTCDTPGVGEGGYSCELHGEQRAVLDPSFTGPFVVLVRVQDEGRP